MATISKERVFVQDVYELIDLIEQGQHRYRIRGGMSHYYIDFNDGVFDIWGSSDDSSELLSVPEMSNAGSCNVAWALANGALYVDN
jgi:hypothetical protein